MSLILVSLAILVIGALGSALWGRTRLATIGPLAAALGSAAAFAAGIACFIDGGSLDLALWWDMPLGSFHIGMDPLSTLFVLLISLVGALAAVYGHGYLGRDSGDGKIAMSWCWYNLLMASMLLVVVARDGFLFLTAWEAMSLASFFLVMYDHEKDEVSRAGWIYLVATHIGTAFLLVMFLLLGHAGDMDFSRLAATGSEATFIFAAALIGFGVKAGFTPLHVWLPEAHPAAPSHVSALMSGVMIKTGIYGILRVMTFLGAPVPWWGWVLVATGVISGVAGVLFALAQHDLKRLLAYHSVENIGIIALGLGIGILGITSGNQALAALGLCGGLLHVINHGLFKSLLFMGAGSVLHATGTREIDHMGGLIKRMPVTGAVFLVGAAAISALPPFNGFVSEFLIYSAGFTGMSQGAAAWGGLAAVAGLALIGGLAAACFTKAFGIVFLGEPRTGQAAKAHESNRLMLWPMIMLAVLCAAIGPLAFLAVGLVMPAASQVASDAVTPETLGGLDGFAAGISIMALCMGGLAAFFFFLRGGLLKNRSVQESLTWDCGYAAPNERMQYTASSFARPIVGMFGILLGTRTEIEQPEGLFPAGASLHTHTDDIFVKRAYGPAVMFVRRLAGLFRRLQQGRTNLYILYIVIAILIMLFWNLW